MGEIKDIKYQVSRRLSDGKLGSVKVSFGATIQHKEGDKLKDTKSELIKFVESGFLEKFEEMQDALSGKPSKKKKFIVKK